jgi:hypothetical protein
MIVSTGKCVYPPLSVVVHFGSGKNVIGCAMGGARKRPSAPWDLLSEEGIYYCLQKRCRQGIDDLSYQLETMLRRSEQYPKVLTTT